MLKNVEFARYYKLIVKVTVNNNICPSIRNEKIIIMFSRRNKNNENKFRERDNTVLHKNT